ncbi:hypothetical protein ACFONC_05905 [Luteimonas soli]|uniref:Uncharacterized protein n=1 Tax=Luteimonas soli TaxID=1648966 RepID=A0ABV7XK23_9GAMM
MNLDEFRALTPWSFFLPIALAVAVGVLVANGLGAVLFGGSDVDEPTADATEAAAADENGKAPAAVEAGSVQATATAKQPAPAKPLPTLEPVSLPGPSGARRDGEVRACIGGTVAVRAENGWEQEVVNDAPARCIASSS